MTCSHEGDFWSSVTETNQLAGMLGFISYLGLTETFDILFKKDTKVKSSHAAKMNYILSQAFKGFVNLLCKCQVMQHLLVLFHSHLGKNQQDGFFIKSTRHLHL